MNENTRAIAALTEIMGSEIATMRRRIEAAEALLTYEAPEEIVEQTKEFLVSVFEDRNMVGTDDRLEASRLMRKVEARKITPLAQTVRAVESDKDYETRREIEIALRRLELYKAGLWEHAEPDWADDLLRSDFAPRSWRALHDENKRLAAMPYAD